MNNVRVFILYIRRCHCPKVSNFDTAASGNTFDLNVCLCRFEHDSRWPYGRYMCVLSGHCFWKDFCLWHSYTWQIIQVCAVISVHLLSYFVWKPINQMYSQLLCKSKISLGGIWLSFTFFVMIIKMYNNQCSYLSKNVTAQGTCKAVQSNNEGMRHALYVHICALAQTDLWEGAYD